MAIILNTGAPGAGKTLRTIYVVELRRKAENREVYYNGIQGLNLPWILLEDPKDWHKLPTGSIIVLDECQQLFRPRSALSGVPEYVSKLETHRHNGYDIYLITQHPTLVEANVRRLVEDHSHIMRKFGSAWTTIHTWKGVKENCDKTRKDSIREEFRYPKEVFGWYKSAELHTHKLKVPMKVWLIFLIPILFALAVWYFYSTMSPKLNPKPATQAAQSGVQPASFKPSSEKPTFDTLSFVPRVMDLPHTAPRYDELTQPTVAPVITGCIVFKKECKCLTQQGTTTRPSMDFCVQVLRNGLFVDFGPQAQASSQPQSSQQRPQPTVENPIATTQSSQIKPPEPVLARPVDIPSVPWTSRFHDTPSLSNLSSK
jgi:zona occludens toxin